VAELFLPPPGALPVLTFFLNSSRLRYYYDHFCYYVNKTKLQRNSIRITCCGVMGAHTKQRETKCATLLQSHSFTAVVLLDRT
jgi:hypothetical protein